MIGPTICIRGDLSGQEDLIIEGRVEGKIELCHLNATIGKNGVSPPLTKTCNF